MNSKMTCVYCKPLNHNGSEGIIKTKSAFEREEFTDNRYGGWVAKSMFGLEYSRPDTQCQRETEKDMNGFPNIHDLYLQLDSFH